MINTAKATPAPILGASVAMVIRAVAAAIPTPGNRHSLLAEILAGVLVGGSILFWLTDCFVGTRSLGG